MKTEDIKVGQLVWFTEMGKVIGGTVTYIGKLITVLWDVEGHHSYCLDTSELFASEQDAILSLSTVTENTLNPIISSPTYVSTPMDEVIPIIDFHDGETEKYSHMNLNVTHDINPRYEYKRKTTML
jgi:hypothetical protein